MATDRYIFGDIVTGEIVGEIPLYGVSMAKGIGTGEFRGSFQLDQTGQSNATLLDATIPGRCFVVCEREGQPIWGGIVWTRTYQSQAKVSQLYVRGIEHYPDRRIVREDLSWENTEQLNIFLELWEHMQSDANSVQIVLPSASPDITLKSLEVKASEFKTYRQLMDELANASDGFDWTVDIIKVENSYAFQLRLGFPYIGSQEPSTATFFDYPGSITNYWQNESMGSTGTHIYAIGTGEGSTMLSVEVIHDDLVESRFPRFDVDVSLKGIQDINILTALAIQQATIRKAPGATLTIETKADIHPQFGTYGLGDLATVTMQDPKHPNVEDQVKSARIIGWEYYPASGETVAKSRIVLEGADE